MGKEGVEYYSTVKKKEVIPSAATWINLEILTLSEVRQKMNIIYHLHVKSERMIQIISLCKTEVDAHRHRTQTYGYQRRRGERRAEKGG